MENNLRANIKEDKGLIRTRNGVWSIDCDRSKEHPYIIEAIYNKIRNKVVGEFDALKDALLYLSEVCVD